MTDPTPRIDTFEPPQGDSLKPQLWGLIVSIGLVAVGFADGLNSVLTFQQFQTDFCQTPTPERPSRGPYFPHTIACVDERTYRVVYLIGSVLGPLLSGFVVTDRFGRRVAVVVGAVVFVVGCTLALASPAKLAVSLVIARGVQGLGLFLWSYVAVYNDDAYNFDDNDDGLRGNWTVLFVIALAIALVSALGVLCLAPQSPRWTQVIAHADVCATADKPDDARCCRLHRPSSLAVVATAAALVTLQQIFCLSNLVQASDAMQTYARYVEMEVETMNASKMLARGFSSNQMLVAIVVLVPGLASLVLLDSRVGRRRLLLIGAVGMGVCHAAANMLLSAGCEGEIFQRMCRGSEDQFAMYLSVLAIFRYGFSWGPVGMIYPLEMSPTEVRARGFALAVALSSAIVMSIKEFWPELVNFTAVSIPCAVLATVFVWFRVPETKKLSLEDAAVLFDTGSFVSRSTLNVA
ncbi:hypothetical protein PybrP1_001037 [[Pythium] brassicae (nom. inval.)]|nr:hypothetical protein PybrP1_001037 [[Pythium] brassicae (nom. inval.)]